MQRHSTSGWVRRAVLAAAALALPAALAAQAPSSEEIQRQREESERQRREYLDEKARVDAINERVRQYKELMRTIPFEPVPGTSNLVQVYMNGHDLRDVATRIYNVSDDASPAGFNSAYWPEVLFLNRAKDYDTGVKKGRALIEQYQDRYPRAMECLAKSLEECLTCLKLPEAHRRRVRTANGLERLIEEARRRTEAAGTEAAALQK